MEKNKDKLFYALLWLTFLVFLFLRIFSSTQYEIILRSDAGRYLELAKNFPYHTFHNNQLYITHPPFYPYLIHFFSYLFEDHIAGLFISLISAIVTFFVIWKLVILLTDSKYAALGTLVLYSLSSIYINMSTIILKESFSVMLTLLSIYFFVLFFKNGGYLNVILSAVFGALLGMTTDIVVPLIPALIAIFIIFGSKKKFWKASIPVFATILVYSLWILFRLYVYTHFEYYPASQDGTIVRVSDWSLINLVNTLQFKDTGMWFAPGISLDPAHYIYPVMYLLNLIIAPWPKGLSFNNISILLSSRYLFQLLLYSVLSIAILYSLYRTGKYTLLRGIKSNGMLLCLTLFLIFLMPLMSKFTATRYIIPSAIFLFATASYGLVELSKKFRLFNSFKAILTVIIIILVLYLPFYYVSNNYFILSKIKVVEAKNTAQFLNELPKNGIMTQTGYTQEIDYQTDKRVVALPADTAHMFLMDLYGINYALYGEFYRRPFIEGNETGFFNYYVVKYIREHPKEFKLLKVMEVSYPTIDRKDHIYVYEVVKR